MHRLLARQLARTTCPAGDVDLDALLRLVDAAYLEADQERARTERATLVTCEEMDELNTELRKLAHHDPLTGLPNRLAFSEFAVRAVQRARLGESLAVLLIDLDRFKLVNDTFGHSTGDALLCEVAARLRGVVRENDFVARMGGDEFAIIQVGSDQPNSAEALARRLVERLSGSYAIRGHGLAVGGSVGVVFADPSADDVDILLHRADLALYRAKHDGRCTWRIFDPEMAAVESDVRALGPDRAAALPAVLAG
jgi:diguanylate cyclase (GGDEF)-like protein